MDMNPMIIEHIWRLKKEEIDRKAAFRETYKLYQEFDSVKRALKKISNR
jgi:hypothetical protein